MTMTMTDEHKAKARAWYAKHKGHVDRICMEDGTSVYEPSSEPYHLGGDAHDPALWKPAHWRWFLASD